jgi:integrase
MSGGVYQNRKSPNWQYDFVVNGQRYHGSTGCTSKTAARAYVANLRNRIAAGVQEKEAISVDEAFGLYWDAVGQHESNHKTTEGQLERMKKFFGAGTPLADIDRADIDRYLSRRRAQTATNRETLVSNATVNRETQLLKRVINRVPDRYQKPAIEWKGVTLREAQERIRELSADEERRLFAQLPPDLANFAEFAMLSGQRRSAIVTLVWSKVDLSAGIAEVKTKGNRWHRFPLSPRMIALLANLPKVGPRVFTYLCERNAPRRPGRAARVAGHRYPLSYQGWSRKWRKALADAGIEDFRFHDLRHTAATRIVRETGNLKIAMRLLDHSTITTTARYAHASDDDVRKALSAVDPRNNPGPENQSVEISREEKRIA